MSLLLSALLAALSLELPVVDRSAASPFDEQFDRYRSFSTEECRIACEGGDRIACLMGTVERLRDETVPVADIYGELSGARLGDPEFRPRILASDEARALRSAAIHLLVTTRWRAMDPSMIQDLIAELGPPYRDALHPLYLRRLADTGRMADFVAEYRPGRDEGLARIYLRHLIKNDPEAAFDFLKGLGPMKFSEDFDEEVEKLFNEAWGGKKDQRRDYLLWRMYAHYRAFRYDRCLKVGTLFPKSGALRDTTDWRANLLRAMANTRKREHRNALEIYRNLEAALDRFELPEEDIHDFYRWSGYSYGAIGQNDRSIAAYLAGHERLAATDRADSFLYYAADMERLTEHWDRAEALYQRLLTEHPHSSYHDLVSFLLFWLRYVQARYDDALLALQEITQSSRPNSYDAIRARYWQARIDERKGDQAAAVAALHDIAAEQPFSYYGMLAASRLRAKNLSVAIPVHDGADLVRSAPEDLLPELRWALALYLRGDLRQTSSFLWLTAAAITGSGTPGDRFLAALLAQGAGSFGLASRFVRSLPPVAEFSGDLARMQYPIAYEEEILPHTELYGVPPLFVYSIARQESLFDVKAVSVSNATGLLQLLTGTAQLLANDENYGGRVTMDRLKRPFTNARFGVKFLGNLLKRYKGNIALAAAAYNAGPGKVNRWIDRMAGMELDEFVENIPIFQTRNYVKKVLGNYAAYRFFYDHVPEDGIEFVLPQ